MKNHKLMAAPLAVLGLIVASIGFGAATVGPARAYNTVVQTIAGSQSSAPAAVNTDEAAPFIWDHVGGDPLLRGGVNDRSLASFLASPRARACARKQGIPMTVWNRFIDDARKNPRALHSTMKTHASFDSMAFGTDCKVVGKTWYTGSPEPAFTGSYTYRGKLWTLTLPKGCANIAVTSTRVPTPKVIIKKVEVPRPTKMAVAIMYAKSNSTSQSEAQAQCPAGTVAAQASAGAWAYAYAKAIGFGYGDAQRRAYAYALAKTGTTTTTSVTCNSPPAVQPPPTTTTTTTVVTTTTVEKPKEKPPPKDPDDFPGLP